MAFLYTFHGNKLRIFEGFFRKKVEGYPKRLDGKMYFQTKNGRKIINEIEGEVHNNQLWLEIRDDKKAVDLLIRSRQDKMVKLEAEMEELTKQINDLYLTRVVIQS